MLLQGWVFATEYSDADNIYSDAKSNVYNMDANNIASELSNAFNFASEKPDPSESNVRRKIDALLTFR